MRVVWPMPSIGERLGMPKPTSTRLSPSGIDTANAQEIGQEHGMISDRLIYIGTDPLP
jgi:hypothetical protein